MSTDSGTPHPNDDLEALRQEVEQLRERVADLEDRVQSSSTLPPAAKDYRDARVLDALEPGEIVTLRQFHQLFREHTDIRNEETLRERTKNLAESDAFENVGHRRWQYRGPGDDA